MKIFVGNLAPAASEEDLKQACEPYGQVASVNVPQDKEGQPRGFGFVEMASTAAGQALLAGLNGQEIKGQAVKVSEARPDSHHLRGSRNPAGPGGRSQMGPNRGPGSGKGGGSKGGFNVGMTGRNKV